MALKNKLELCLSNQITELQNVNMQLEQFGELWNLPFELVFNLNLVLEEVLSNIIFYGYDDSAEHTIELNIELQDDNIF
jgi:serine/threonine-protein kinase RsbW